jgi:hypothetical protein
VIDKRFLDDLSARIDETVARARQRRTSREI